MCIFNPYITYEYHIRTLRYTFDPGDGLFLEDSRFKFPPQDANSNEVNSSDRI